MKIFEKVEIRNEYVVEEIIIKYKVFGVTLWVNELERNMNSPEDPINFRITFELFKFKPSGKLGKFLLRKYYEKE